ncbi:lymphocyte antigen 6E-like [Podarcis muralis]|uniref:lymphocyte antigen 6E-like n=1 Tax=Podarcis raffonei TaxID=65483 RepID=UPI0023290353|nr:lymphocyte antigen 6E-like [Podarcis raffonei]
MKKASYLLSLLGAVIVCTQIAHSIICFTCERQPSNWKCLQMTICPDNENACLTMRDVDETGDSAKVLITKKCGQACPTESNNSSSAPKSVFCCKHNWCNLWPPK